MCIEFLLNEGETHPMTYVSKAVFNYLSKPNPSEDGLRDYLAEEYEANRIKKCGCGDKDFKLTKTSTGYEVTMNSVSGMLYLITITDTEYGYELVPFSYGIEDYGEIKYNEYKE